MLQTNSIQEQSFHYFKYSLYAYLFFWNLNRFKFKSVYFFYIKWWLKSSHYNFRFKNNVKLTLYKHFKFSSPTRPGSFNLLMYNNTNHILISNFFNIFYLPLFYFFTITFFYKKLNLYFYLFVGTSNKPSFKIRYVFSRSQNFFQWHFLL